MTDAERRVLRRLAGGTVWQMDFADADWAAVVELGIAGLVQRSERAGQIELTEMGRRVAGVSERNGQG